MSELLRPELTVAAVVERRGRYLVIEEMVQGRPVFNQPAGHVEPGESLVEAVVRETLEEAAWHLSPDFITGIYLFRDDATSRTYLRVVFTGSVYDHQPERDLDDGILRSLWLSREDLATRAERLRSPLVLRSIDDYLLGHRLPADPGGLEGLAARAVRV